MKLLTTLLIGSLTLGPLDFSQAGEFDRYKKGVGAKFKISMPHSPPAQLMMYVVDKSSDEIGLEFYFSNPLLPMPLKLWQQFRLKGSAKSGLQLTEGYLQDAEMKQPQRLPREYLQGYEGVQMNSFLIGGREDLDEHYVGDAEKKVGSATVTTKHYRIEENGQTVEFWLHEKAEPFGLVALKSEGQKSSQNYQLELKGLVKNARGKIEPSKAVPLSDKMRGLLPKLPGGGAGLNLL